MYVKKTCSETAFNTKLVRLKCNTGQSIIAYISSTIPKEYMRRFNFQEQLFIVHLEHNNIAMVFKLNDTLGQTSQIKTKSKEIFLAEALRINVIHIISGIRNKGTILKDCNNQLYTMCDQKRTIIFKFRELRSIFEFFFIFYIGVRGQQWIDFLLLISAHVILSIRESTVLKFNYSDSIILTKTLRLQWVWVQRWHQTHNIRNTADYTPCSRRSLVSSVSAY